MKHYQRVIASLLCIIMCFSFSSALAEENPWMAFPQEEAVDISDLIDGYDKYQAEEVPAPPVKTQEDYDAEITALDAPIQGVIDTAPIPGPSGTQSAIDSESDPEEPDTSGAHFRSPYYGITGNEQVSTISGDLNYRYPLLSLPGRNGLDLNLSLNYNSADALLEYAFWSGLLDSQKQMAAGWTFDLSHVDYIGSTKAILTLSSGRTLEFNPLTNEFKNYDLEDIAISSLSENGKNYYVVTFTDGHQEWIGSSSGLLEKKVDRFGNTITYTYADVPVRESKTIKLPTAITDSVGRVISINYQHIKTDDIYHLSQMTVSVDGQVQQTVSFTLGDYSTIFIPTASQIYYFTTYPLLTSVQNAVGETTSFTYNSGVLLKTYHDLGWALSQDLQIMLTGINYPSGGGTNYVYDKITKTSASEESVGVIMERYVVTARMTSYGFDAWYDYGTRNHTGATNSQELYSEIANYTNEETGYLANQNYTYSTTVTHQNGSKVKYTYNNRHMLIEEREMNYDEAGDVQKTEWTYDESNLPTEKLVTTGRLDDTSTLSYLYQKEMWEYDDAANVTRHIALMDVANPDDDPATLSGRKETVSTYLEVNGKITAFPLSVTALFGTPKQQKVVYTYSADGKNLLTETAYHGSANTRGNKVTYTYDTAYPGNITGIITYGAADNKLTETVFTYDATYHAYVATETAKGVSTYNNNFQTETKDITASYTYDTFGRTLTTTQNSMTTTYTYDAAGRMTRETMPDNTVNTYSHQNTSGRYIITATYGGLYTQKFYYDNIGQLCETAELSENGTEVLLESNAYNSGQLTSVTDGEGHITAYTYDVLGRPLSEVTGSAGYYYTYDDVNRTVKTVDTLGRISVTEYDEDQNPVKTHAYSGGADSTASEIFTTLYEYDIMGNNTKVTDANGKVTTSVYDTKGQLTSVTDALNRTTGYTYDDLGQVTSVTMPGNRVSTYTYDTLGRLIRTDNPGNSVSESAYDDSGRVVKSYKDGVTATYFYKPNTSLVCDTSYTDGTNNTSTHYTYDALGNLLTYRQGTDTSTLETYSYYPNGNLKKYTAPDGKYIQYTYNKIGQVTSITDYFGETTNYTYNNNGYLYEVKEGETLLQNYYYNAMGQVTQSSNAGGAAYSQYTYDELGRLTRKINQNWGTNLGTYNYTYDKVGNILSKTDGTGTTTYAYDNLYRLSSVTAPDTTLTAYLYDTAGNITNEIITHPDDYVYTYEKDGVEYTVSDLNIHQKQYTYNSRNQLTLMVEDVYSNATGTLADQTAYTYDARGNVLTASRMGVSDSQVESYTYNLLGTMTSYTKDGTTTSYTYDSSGLRTSKTNGGNTTRYYLSGGMVVNEGTVSESGVALSATNYIGNEIFGRKNASDTVTSFLLSNGHGDIEAVMQGSTRVGTYQYDAYGNATVVSEATGFTNPIRYAGEYFDEESGNYYLRARYYNPSLGRFMAEDPIMDGQNWYAYCAGNPVMYVDPSGENRITDTLNSVWNGTKQVFQTIGNYANEAQEAAQRVFWMTGAQLVLRVFYGYETAAWLLEHSLQDTPSDIYRDSNSRISNLISLSSELNDSINNLIKNSTNGTISFDGSIAFSSGELFYSINKANVVYTGIQQDDGSWFITGTLTDVYDYTEMVPIMNSNDGFLSMSLGATANNIAVVSQQAGAINPYNITVDFVMRIWVL